MDRPLFNVLPSQEAVRAVGERKLLELAATANLAAKSIMVTNEQAPMAASLFTIKMADFAIKCTYAGAPRITNTIILGTDPFMIQMDSEFRCVERFALAQILARSDDFIPRFKAHEIGIKYRFVTHALSSSLRHVSIMVVTSL